MIPLLKVHMPQDVFEPLKNTLLSGQVAEGPKVIEFEKELSKYIGNEFIVSTNSCSGALQMSLQLAGVKPGDEVITTAMTCQATNQPILQLGAKPVWADIQSETGNIDPTEVKKLVTKKTKAIIVMHWAGQPGDIDELNQISKEHNISLIEDAASAFGASYKGKRIGCHSDFVCFSFQAIKHITTGDGGALCVKDLAHRDRAILMRNQGNNRKAVRDEISWQFDITEPGWKFHMNDISATIGLKQLEYQEILLKKRITNGEYYTKNLVNIPGLDTLKQKHDRVSAYWIFTVLVENKAGFVARLKEKGIQTSIVHQRNDIHSIFHPYHRSLPNLDSFYKKMINVPVGWWLSQDDLEFIVETIKEGW